MEWEKKFSFVEVGQKLPQVGHVRHFLGWRDVQTSISCNEGCYSKLWVDISVVFVDARVGTLY